ncbi:MAG: acyl-CoA dehydratase activase [Clostridiales bacterium]
MNKKIVGIDLGSRSVKIVLMDNMKITETKVMDTAKFYREFCSYDRSLKIDLFKLGIDNLSKIVSTGYGRNNAKFEGAKIIQELKAHTYGAVWQNELENFVLLDIGGQDSKGIMVKNGKISDMLLNDKCAASCGRYLENMANVLGVNLEEISLHYKEPIKLNSTCAIFSESELIGYISEGINVNRLIAGVNFSLYNRVKQLIERFDSDTLILSGGVSLNNAILQLFRLNSKFKNVIVSKRPQLNGAIGCCVYGFESKL